MLSARGIRITCPKCISAVETSLLKNSRSFISPGRSVPGVHTNNLVTQRRNGDFKRFFSVSRHLGQESSPESVRPTQTEIEQTVREAKQRFRDTLPQGYLTDEEHQLYVRWYGPPLRETTPEDVGIPTHADMGDLPDSPRPSDEGTGIRQLEEGGFEEFTYRINRDIQPEQSSDMEEVPENLSAVIEKAPGYIESVARNSREREALQRLMNDFEVTREEQRRLEAEQEDLEAHAEDMAAMQGVSADPPEELELDNETELERDEPIPGAQRRFHPYTMGGKFNPKPIEITLPYEGLVVPIKNHLARTSISHVKQAAESNFEGTGLPTSPATPQSKRNGHMGPVGLPPEQRHMTEIEADAFLAAYLPPMYASAFSVLREVRQRMGSTWLQSKLKLGNLSDLSVLDVGGGGAGLIAWEEILKAEWDVLKDEGEVQGDGVPGKKTAVVASDRLRYRVKDFLHNTTILPRLPDYVHSGAMKSSPHLDAPDTPQPRKQFDVVIASHLFLKEKQQFKRDELLENLWTMVKEDGGVLIVIEKAHPRGFEAMAHARDTVLSDYLLPQPGQSLMPSIVTGEVDETRTREPGHIIAPCTNQTKCPMYKVPGKSAGRKDFCHFNQRFVRPQFYNKMFSDGGSNSGEVEYSYFAVQRGVAKESVASSKELTDEAFKGYEMSESEPDYQSLPRLLLPALKRTGHVTLDVCTPQGTAERWTVPKSFSKQAYHDARKSRWGDIWALGAKTRTAHSLRLGKGADEHESVQKKAKRMVQDGEMLQKHRQKSRKAQKQELVRELMEEEERQAGGSDAELDDEIDLELQMEGQAMKQFDREERARRRQIRGEENRELRRVRGRESRRSRGSGSRRE